MVTCTYLCNLLWAKFHSRLLQVILSALKPIIHNLERRKCDHINDQLKAVFLKKLSGSKQKQAFVLTGHKDSSPYRYDCIKKCLRVGKE